MKNRTQDLGSQYENNKVFLEIAHGDQDFAEALSRLASPSLVGRCNKEMELGGTTYRPRVEAWAAVQSMRAELQRKEAELYEMGLPEGSASIGVDNGSVSMGWGWKRRNAIGAPMRIDADANGKRKWLS